MMRYADNCAIIGGKSGGGGGMPLSYEMPCGWTVRFSSVRMYDRDKNDIEDGERGGPAATCGDDGLHASEMRFN